jgi:hypothetical protein
LWEANFCKLAAQHHRSFSPHQFCLRDKAANWYRPEKGQIYPLLLPDTTIWTAPGEHHEIKHKEPTKNWPCYGLEKYRLDALLAFAEETRQSVLYTIHDWRRAGASTSSEPMRNCIDDWLTCDVLVLADYIRAEHLTTNPFPTWYGGVPTTKPGYFWPTTLWRPLHWWWTYPLDGIRCRNE